MLIERRELLANLTSAPFLAAAPAAVDPSAPQSQLGRSAYDLVRDFAAVGDGATDNAAALRSFNEAAKKESTAGRRVVLTIPPGIYNFNHARCIGFLMGIKDLTIFGSGAVFQNTYDPTEARPFFAAEQAWGLAGGGGRLNEAGKPIESLAIGASRIQLKTLSDSAEFSVGDWMLVGSLDIQYYGFPPNFYYFEFVQISQVDAGTGSISIKEKIRWPHRDDFPDNKVIGKARVWNMRSKGNIPWDVTHVYHGLEIRNSPRSTVPYITAAGLSITYENCILPGLSQTVSRRVVMRGGALTGGNEPDKLVDQCVYESVSIQKGLVFQSSSINSANLRDCDIHGVLIIGMVKNFHAQNCDVQWLIEGAGRLGLNLAATLENCYVHRMDLPIRIVEPGNIATRVDGDTITYANGRFTISKLSQYLSYWNSAPGAALNLQASKSIFSGQTGTGYITSITEDEAHIYWETTLPYKELPEWADGSVRVQKAGQIRVVNCTGCSAIAMASAATAVGKQPWEYRKFMFLGVADQAGSFAGCDGILIKATVNVIQRGPRSSNDPQLVLTHSGAVIANNMSDPQNYSIAIDISESGKRQFSTEELRGKRGTDSVRLAGKDLSTLPDDRYCFNALAWSYVGFTPSKFAAGQLPIVEVILEFDPGLYRNGIQMGKDTSGKTIAGISGLAL